MRRLHAGTLTPGILKGKRVHVSSDATRRGCSLRTCVTRSKAMPRPKFPNPNVMQGAILAAKPPRNAKWVWPLRKRFAAAKPVSAQMAGGAVGFRSVRKIFCQHAGRIYAPASKARHVNAAMATISEGGLKYEVVLNLKVNRCGCLGHHPRCDSAANKGRRALPQVIPFANGFSPANAPALYEGHRKSPRQKAGGFA